MHRLRLVRFSLVTPPLIFFVWVAYYGIDFGHHWDEPFLMNSVATSAEANNWLPLYYNYPSAAYWLGVTASLPDILSNQQEIGTTLRSETALIRVRHLFVLTYAAGIAISYALTLYITRAIIPALLTAFVLASSWEVGYHARWVAPDGLVFLFVPLTMLLCIIALKHQQQRRWLWLAAVAGGLTVGSKYNAALFALSVPLTAWFIWRMQTERLWRQLMSTVLKIAAIGLIAFLIITPGVLLETTQFVEDIREEITHYSEMGHHNHTVAPGVDHLLRNVTYLGAVVLSTELIIAIAITALIIPGLIGLWRQNWRYVVLIVGFPCLYLLYMSGQRAMLVRNLLVIVPFMSVLLGVGVWTLIRWRHLFGYTVAAILTGFIILNSITVVQYAQTIRERKDTNFLAEQVADYINSYPETTLCISTAVGAHLRAINYQTPGNVRYFEPTDYVLFSTQEVILLELEANWPGLYTHVFGTKEVNYDYYPDWGGDEHILMIPYDAFLRRNLTIGNCEVPA